MLSFLLKGCTDCNSLDSAICGVDGVLANYGKNAWQNVSYLTNKSLPRHKVKMLMYYREILSNLKWDQCFYTPFSYPDIVSRAMVLTDGFVPIVKRYVLPIYTTTTSTTTTTTSSTTTTTSTMPVTTTTTTTSTTSTTTTTTSSTSTSTTTSTTSTSTSTTTTITTTAAPEPFGLIYSGSNWSDLDDFTTEGTWTVVGNNIRGSSGITPQSNFLSPVGWDYSDLVNWSFDFTQTIGTSNGSSAGLWAGIQARPDVTAPSSSSIYLGVNFNLSTSPYGKFQIIIHTTIFFFQYTSTGVLTSINPNDVLRIQCSRTDNVIAYTVTNVTTSETFSGSFTGGTGTLTLPSVGALGLVDVGEWQEGYVTLNSLSISTDVNINLDGILVGDSKIAGYKASTFETDLFHQLLDTPYSVGNESGGGQVTADVINYLPELIRLTPHKVFLAIGSNDIRSGVSSVTWQANINTIISTLQTAGITVINVLPMKENAGGGGVDIDPLYTFLNGLSNQKVDCYTAFNIATMLDFDGIHPNQAGNDFMYAQFVASGLLN